MADIPGDTGIGLDTRALVSGTDIVGVFSSGAFSTIGSTYLLEVDPNDATQNNAVGSLIYTGALLGSIIQNVGGTEFAKVLGYSGASNSLVSIGSWTPL